VPCQPELARQGGEVGLGFRPWRIPTAWMANETGEATLPATRGGQPSGVEAHGLTRQLGCAAEILARQGFSDIDAHSSDRDLPSRILPIQMSTSLAAPWLVNHRRSGTWSVSGDRRHLRALRSVSWLRYHRRL